MRRLFTIVLALAALTVAAPASAATVSVRILGSGFSPANVTINADDTVTWTNRDNANHQIVADDGSFASPVLAPNRSYSFTFRSAGTFRYRDALSPSRRGVVFVKGPPPAVSIGATAPIIVYGGGTHLQGVVSSKSAGETVTILTQPYGQASYTQAAVATTGAGGAFDLAVNPTILTNYQAQFRNASSQPITVQVQPKITLLPGGGGFFLVRVAAVRSFAGRDVYLQRRNEFGQWVSVQKFKLGRLSGKLFRPPRRPGVSKYRIFMTVNQAGVGYLASSSGTQTITVRRR